METVVTINLNGQLLQIETPAHDALRTYLTRLATHFSSEPGYAEIVADIESRVAELLYEKQRQRGVVTLRDVEEVTQLMGQPEDLGAPAVPASSQATASTSSASSASPPARRLTRNTKDKWLGGVCSGIAHHFNLDPSLVRLVFALVTVGGFGFGFIIYPLLWAILPANELPETSGKRLFRNPDDKIVGGVASGLAAYLGKDVAIIRLLFAAPILLNISIGILSFDVFHGVFPGSLSGLVILGYIVMWAVLPKASNPYQKRQMRGEVVNVELIHQVVQIERQHDAPRVTYGNARGFAGPLPSPVRGIALVFKAMLWVMAGIIVVSFAAAAVAAIVGLIIGSSLVAYAFSSDVQAMLGWGTLIFFVAWPIAALVIWFVRRVAQSKPSPLLGWVFGIGWIIGWICAPLLAASVARDMRRQAVVKKELTVLAADQALRIRAFGDAASCEDWNFADEDDNDNGTCRGVHADESGLAVGRVELSLRPSKLPVYQVTVARKSRGRTQRDAETRASDIAYEATVTDGVLDLSSSYRVARGHAFRGQHVEVTVRVPPNGRVLLEQEAIDALDVDVYSTDVPRGRRAGHEQAEASLEANQWYVMDSAGEFQPVNHPQVPNAVLPLPAEAVTPGVEAPEVPAPMPSSATSGTSGT